MYWLAAMWVVRPLMVTAPAHLSATAANQSQEHKVVAYRCYQMNDERVACRRKQPTAHRVHDHGIKTPLTGKPFPSSVDQCFLRPELRLRRPSSPAWLIHRSVFPECQCVARDVRLAGLHGPSINPSWVSGRSPRRQSSPAWFIHRSVFPECQCVARDAKVRRPP